MSEKPKKKKRKAGGNHDH